MLCQFQLYSKVNQLYVYMYPLIFQTSLPFRLPQCIRQSSLCCTVCSHLLPILYKVSIMYVCRSQSPNASHPHTFPAWYPYVDTMYGFGSPCLCLCFCLADKIVYTIFLDSTYMHYYTIFAFLFLTYFTLYDTLQVQPRLYK